nr:MAG TPA: hypothetical protein [Caudoviricetes sp.]
MAAGATSRFAASQPALRAAAPARPRHNGLLCG